VVTPSSKNNYKKYNDAVSVNESQGSYTIVNDEETKIVDGKKVRVKKPVEEWAVGRYQHYYKYHEAEIASALKAQGINTNGLSKEDIIKAYTNSPKAQEVVQEQLNEVNFAAAKKQIEKHGLKAPVEEIAYLNHFLGNGGASRYIRLFKKYGVEKADQIMAYGNDPDDPGFKGVGGPESAKKNELVSVQMLKFRNENNATATTPTPKSATPKENKIVTTEVQKTFDDAVASYEGVQEGSLNGIDEMQYNPMGWGADKGVKRKGQKWDNHDNHIHLGFTNSDVTLAVIKKAEELGLNPDENLYTKGKVTPGKHDPGSFHYQQFEGTYDGKQLSKGLDINRNGTNLSNEEFHKRLVKLYKWIHQTYSI
jgi:hypothetical protein